MNKKNIISNQHWIIILIIIVSGYSLYSAFKDEKRKEDWKYGDFDALIKKCIKDSEGMANKYPELTEEYCNCAIQKIQNQFNRKEYLKISQQSIEKQAETILPIFENCLKDYEEKIKDQTIL